MKSIFKQDSYGKSLEDKVIKAGIEAMLSWMDESAFSTMNQVLLLFVSQRTD
jgi:hypothetical protein